MDVVELGRAVQRTQPVVAGHRNTMAGPTDGSPAAAESAAARSDYERRLIRDAGHAVYARLAVVEDYLHTIGGMLADDATVYSMHPLARAAAETAARVYWQAEPGASARVRAGRYLGDRRASLRSIKSLGFAEAHRHADARLGGLGRESSAARVKVVNPRKATDLVELAVDDDVVGKAIYGWLSAFDHGHLWALHQMIEPVAQDLVHDDVVIGMQVSSRGQRVQVALVAYWPYRMALRAFLDWFGWPAPAVRSHVDATLRALRRSVGG